MQFTRSLGVAAALVISAIVGGTLIGSTLATEETTEAGTASGEAYCDVFMDALAANLGVTRESLVTAGRAAANAAVDAAAEAGDLSEERAEALRERIAEADGTGCGWFGKGFAGGFGHGFGHGAIRGFVGGNVLSDAADTLGMETTDLLAAVREAGSLEAVAEEQSVAYDDVKSAVLSGAQAELDAAVENGMSQERADAILERVTTWLDEGGEIGVFGAGRGPGGWFGPGGGHHGPWDGDSDAGDADHAGA